MSAHAILTDALALLDQGRAHHPGRYLAIDADGRRVKTTDPKAVAWSSIGAIHAVAPVHREREDADTTAAGVEACCLLDDAAQKQGLANASMVDRAGWSATYQAFQCALNLYVPPARRLASAATGAKPRGVEAA